MTIPVRPNRRFVVLALLGGLLLLGPRPYTVATAQPIIFQELPVGSPPAVRFGDAYTAYAARVRRWL